MPKYLDEAGVRKLWAKTKEKASQAQSNAVATAGNYSVNGKKINTNPTLSKSDVGLGNVTNDAQIPLSQKGAVNGVATLGTDGKVPSSQLPSYVDDVLEFNGMSTFPPKGEAGKIYVDTSTNKTYRWSGTAYVEISASLALGETSSTAYAGDKGAKLAKEVSALGNTVGDFPDIVLTGVSTTARLDTDKISIGVEAYDRSTTSYLSTSTEIPAATSTAAGVMSKADKAKLDGIAAGAEVNQNAFSRVTVGSTNIDADNKTDSLTLVAGSNVTITPDATNDKITIAATNTTYGVVTTSANGLMSAADKKILDYYNDSRSGYLEVYSSGFSYYADKVEIGNMYSGSLDDLQMDTISLKAATSTQAGVMSAADKTKLDGIVALTDTEIDAILV